MILRRAIDIIPRERNCLLKTRRHSLYSSQKKKKSLDTLLPLLTLIMRFQAAAALTFSREARETTEYYPSVTSFAWFQGLPAKLRRAIFFLLATAFKVTQIFNRIYVVSGKLRRNYKGI